jgi:hypothetical protein
MCMTVDTTPLELLTITEAARRIGAVGNTLRRSIERHGVKPDAILIEGGKQLRSPLFVAPRLGELKRLVES